MQFLDKTTSQHYKVPELVLMEQAAMHFVWEFFHILSEKDLKKGIVFCGTGNNGADGIAVARLLNERGIATTVCKINDMLTEKKKTTDSFCVQESIYDAYAYPVVRDWDSIEKEDYDFVIDAVFGIGLSRTLNEEYQMILQKINAITSVKFAIDMPSGVNSDNGRLMGTAIKCDYTITFSFGKLGQYLWPGFDYAGKTIVVDMGITQKSWLDKKPSCAFLEKTDFSILPKRVSHSNKGTYGKLLVIAGSKEMCGAAIFVAKAAYRCGVGLVKVFTAEKNRAILQNALPECIVVSYEDTLPKEELRANLNWADAVVVGSGLGMSSMAKEIVSFVHKNVQKPVVWDADALNIFAEDVEQFSEKHAEYIITPHLGEFSRLTKSDIALIQNDLVEMARAFAKTYALICVLKDFHTVTALPSGFAYLNLSGNHGMATGGSGDVLAGVIGALLAQGVKGEYAAAFGVYVHGLAGDSIKEKTGAHAMMASDIIEGLQEVWKGMEYAKH